LASTDLVDVQEMIVNNMPGDDSINTGSDGLPCYRNVANDRARLFPRSIFSRSAPALLEVMDPSSSSSSSSSLRYEHCSQNTNKKLSYHHSVSIK
ncbi:hypothetical protein L9F63_013903, partial [Diploptera punctata]